MTLESELRAFTLAGSEVAAAVANRMHARHLPQTPILPALVYQRVATRRLHDLSGPDGLPRPLMQVTCWGDTPAAAYALAEDLRQRLDGFRGTWGALSIGSCLCVGELDYEDPDIARSAVIQEYQIQYTET